MSELEAELSEYQQRQRVAEMLIEPLEAEGMVRQRGVKVEDHEKWLENLKSRLAYLEPVNLRAVRHSIARAAGGKRRNRWPAILSITNWAHDLQRPPDNDNRMVTSYMASAAGQMAWDRGPEYAVALRMHLRRVRMVPNAYTWQKINANAEEMARRAEYIEDATARAVETEAEKQWLAGFRDAIEIVKKLVFAKEETHEPA